eukprot:g32616.t1
MRIVALRRIKRGEEITFEYKDELINLLRKESTPAWSRQFRLHMKSLSGSDAVSSSVSGLLLLSEAAVSATGSLKSVRLTRTKSSSTIASSSSCLA